MPLNWGNGKTQTHRTIHGGTGPGVKPHVEAKISGYGTTWTVSVDVRGLGTFVARGVESEKDARHRGDLVADTLAALQTEIERDK